LRKVSAVWNLIIDYTYSLFARALCDEDSLQAEVVLLRDVFKQNGYNDRQIHRALNRRPNLRQPDIEPHSVAFLSFVGTIFNSINRVLARYNIKSVGLPHMKLSSLLRPVKNYLGLRTPGVYRISCECGRFYNGQTGRSVDIRLASTAHKTRTSGQVGRS
jgi:hypothetical protein